MAIKLGKYNVCILDLFTDSRTGKLSASKLWLHIANGISSYVVLSADSVDWELLATYNGIVGGSYVAVLFFKLRWGHPGGAVHSGDSGDMLDAPRLADGVDGELTPERVGGTGVKAQGRVRGKRKKAGRAKQ